MVENKALSTTKSGH